MNKRKSPGQHWREYWKNRDAWSVREFAQLCCGWNPSVYKFPSRDAYDEALESINRAVRVRVLPTIDDLAWPPTRAERMYDAVPAFRPSDVTVWALSKYPKKFPFGDSDFPRASDSAGVPSLPKRLRQLLEIAGDVSAGEAQKQIAARIKEAMATSQRDAQAYASLIRPDESVEQDRRAARRRVSTKVIGET